MLDKYIKDRDASVELLVDRTKTAKLLFFFFFIVGWSSTWFSIILLPVKFAVFGIGAGIAFLIFATWFFISMFNYDILIVLKREGEKHE